MLIISDNAEHKLIGVKNRNLKIYRVLEVSRLFDIFERKSLGLVAPKYWEDPYERIFSNSFGIDSQEKRRRYSLEGYTKNIYGLCWTLNDENDSTWRIYSPNKDRVKIKTTINKLYKSVSKIDDKLFESYIGKVKYIKENTIIKNIKKAIRKQIETFRNVNFIKEFYLKKRDSFKHENEVRLLVKTPPTEENEYYHRIDFIDEKSILNIPIKNPTDFIEEIVFDPRMPDNIINAFISHLKKEYKYNKNIFKSKLYLPPNVNIKVVHKFDRLLKLKGDKK